jgi:hypothetical protein
MNFKNIAKNNKIPILESREDFPILIRQMGYKKICEVGSHRGWFLSILSLSKPDHLVGVDVWDKYDKEAYSKHPGYYNLIFPHCLNKIWREKAQAMAEKSDLNIDIIVDLSVEAAKQFEDGYFDFVYIDANHTYESVIADLEAWYPKVRKGGMIAGHDYLNFTRDGGKLILNCKDGIDAFVKKTGKEKDLMLTGEEKWKSFYFVK